MSEEDGFLGKLLDQPNSDLTRLVYADWLDERGTAEASAKAEFLRLIADAEVAGKFRERVKVLAEQFDPQWLATVSKLPIENCRYVGDPDVDLPNFGFRLGFECPKRWEELGVLDGGSEERSCDKCQQTVYYCRTARELELHVNRRHCVAVDLAVLRKPGDATPARSHPLMGLLIADPAIREHSEEEEPRRSWWSRLWRRG